MRVAVTGSSGLIGSALVDRLRARGDDVVRLVRRGPGPGEVRWDPSGDDIDRAGIEGLDAVVHLAGEPVAGRRWNAAHKAKVRASRVDGTRLLAGALAAADRRPAVLVSGAAIGIYGDRGDEELVETSPPGGDFLARVCQDWEAATAPALAAGIRVACIRTGVVLAPGGGALAKMLPLFKLGLGGPLAGGRQWMSWISIDDHIRAVLHVIDGDLSGPVNLTAPAPVRNRELTRALARALHRPAFLPVPRFALDVVLGREMAAALLASQRVMPARLRASGFDFHHPTVESAFAAVVGDRR